MNKVILVGNLTKDPELNSTASGISVCNMDVAVNRDYVNEDGEREVDFFRVKIWRNRAENCAKYLRKGSKIAVEGSLQNRTYEDKEGKTRYITEIKADNIEFLSHKVDITNDENGGSGSEGCVDECKPKEEKKEKKATKSSKGVRRNPKLDPVNDEEQLPF